MAEQQKFVVPNKIKACIFDSDGTIVDTLAIYWSMMEEMANDKFTTEFKVSLNGRSDIDVATAMVTKYNMGMTPEEYLAKRDPIINKRLAFSPLVKGIDRIIRKVHEMGIPKAIGTSSQREPFEIKYSQHPEIRNLFQTTVCGDEVKQAKPDPTVFLVASKKLGDFKPENVLVFEDAYIGVVAARNAGMNVVMLHNDGTDFEENVKQYGARPTKVVEDWDDFDFSWFDWDVQAKN
ncbi:HAD-superfamily hydrolase, subfamily IA, variant 3 containing protein [Trichomonas vaginalis G3]|uniref:HAD-superfamily hydrolase, subfamily IA, variant 3 containing protein n=1 Tax=Trichomonas vaginalis (strain ATCC PRA-98 / G3) TaxID=412133 RepID=A2EXA3_TRIV3|nr:pseudouridine 5'-phosphatase protein [Trichomonas vaginalis G3]EAY02702.1 HAD-superfamily hydrolase, subfamily IA, variant 3 containing protein [Trichomonas vaginalis G3]KAI5513513.1 pseudouridine 5'-phosphatase protein [Trichomonas vaginalis G3]|eukprot:XP_001314925.1 HAD-superfamily hydrolase, subfamily IA, variant 3 containing protein [Trichomonas vaginalis G3]